MKKIAAITLCIMFFGVGGVYAQPLQRHTFEIGTEIYYKFYEFETNRIHKVFVFGVWCLALLHADMASWISYQTHS